MDMGSAKFVLAVVAVWGVPVHYFDVPSANVKAEVEGDYNIYFYPPQGLLFSYGE